MHRSVDRGMERRTLKGIAHVSIDEKALKRSLCAAQEREEPYQISGRDFQGNPRSESGSQCCLTVT